MTNHAQFSVVSASRVSASRRWLRDARTFLHQTDGAVTVDWTVLAAAIVGIGLSAVAFVRSGANDLSVDINASLSNASVAFISGVDLSLALGEIWTPLSEWFDILRPETAAMNDEDLEMWLSYYSDFMEDPSMGEGTGFSQDVFRDVYATLQVEYESRGNSVGDTYYDLRNYLSEIG